MRAMVLEEVGKPLRLQDLPLPTPGPKQVLVKVHACSVCRTDLHILDGEVRAPKLPLILGHQIVGKIEGEEGLVGIPWLGKTCGVCTYCKQGAENLCEDPTFTGLTIDGGFAEYVVADRAFTFPIPQGFSDVHAAPLLCAGMIGYRSMRMIKGANKIGFYGFGAAAHLLIQVANHLGKEVYAFTRPGDYKTQEKAKDLGAVWAGDSSTTPPDQLDAAILFAPVGELVPKALQAVHKGGSVVCAGIHMSDLPSFPYSILWGERVLRSVANLTRQDGEEFLQLAAQIPIQTNVTTYPLEQANEALHDLREGKIDGSAVLIP